jgi:hypothetical protein
MASKEEFSVMIERFAKDKRCSYMDAVILYAEENEIEVESAARMISQSLKEKIEVEAQDLNFLPKSARLPI